MFAPYFVSAFVFVFGFVSVGLLLSEFLQGFRVFFFFPHHLWIGCKLGPKHGRVVGHLGFASLVGLLVNNVLASLLGFRVWQHGLKEDQEVGGHKQGISPLGASAV